MIIMLKQKNKRLNLKIGLGNQIFLKIRKQACIKADLNKTKTFSLPKL